MKSSFLYSETNLRLLFATAFLTDAPARVEFDAIVEFEAAAVSMADGGVGTCAVCADTVLGAGGWLGHFAKSRDFHFCLNSGLSVCTKAEGNRSGTPQRRRSDVVRSEAFCNAFGTFEAGLMLFSSTAMSKATLSPSYEISSSRR